MSRGGNFWRTTREGVRSAKNKALVDIKNSISWQEVVEATRGVGGKVVIQGLGKMSGLGSRGVVDEKGLCEIYATTQDQIQYAPELLNSDELRMIMGHVIRCAKSTPEAVLPAVTSLTRSLTPVLISRKLYLSQTAEVERYLNTTHVDATPILTSIRTHLTTTSPTDQTPPMLKILHDHHQQKLPADVARVISIQIAREGTGKWSYDGVVTAFHVFSKEASLSKTAASLAEEISKRGMVVLPAKLVPTIIMSVSNMRLDSDAMVRLIAANIVNKTWAGFSLTQIAYITTAFTHLGLWNGPCNVLVRGLGDVADRVDWTKGPDYHLAQILNAATVARCQSTRLYDVITSEAVSRMEGGRYCVSSAVTILRALSEVDIEDKKVLKYVVDNVLHHEGVLPHARLRIWRLMVSFNYLNVTDPALWRQVEQTILKQNVLATLNGDRMTQYVRSFAYAKYTPSTLIEHIDARLIQYGADVILSSHTRDGLIEAYASMGMPVTAIAETSFLQGTSTIQTHATYSVKKNNTRTRQPSVL